MLSDIFGSLLSFCTNIISTLGYPGIFLLMVMESMIFPVPSELVMPFAGYLASTNQFSLSLVILVSALGSIVGSLISYFIGSLLGRGFVLKFGKFFLLHEADLLWTESWFHKHGAKTIFFARFIPVVRHVISIPAGTAKMNKLRFSLYTIIGASLWNSFLAYCGYVLGNNWELVKQYSDYLTIIAVILLMLALFWFIYHHMKKK